ncbi:RagB/SusD family nutrient uptake outer membrane protein [Flavobacterium geliluteum]|uniref:RagB/SusD family nutrient uptake outer membrane protein n=1 Tax=Flavobacterium geliluteum TaxID=2816120 RepID=A0A941B2A0_9FLAO|nr:RagB/SusD family nutrient uptake outer membrane protein [Flavobacterium geliluteum]MBP4137248.1 RagB/SusD family nutrient uptake outer membrane protein [Flavobacterium geliluteum]
MKTFYDIAKQMLWLAILSFFINSCDSFLEVDLPKSQLTTVTVFEDYATANAALTSIYAKIRDKGLLTGNNIGLSNQLGNYTDEIIPYGTPSNPSLTFYNNSLLAENPDVAQYWNDSYNQIYAANSLIEGIEASTKLSDQNKKQLKGEALFIRALVHFYLVNIFGDVPYITITDYKKNSKVSRMPSSEVYQNIIGDLQSAITLLQKDYSALERIRADKYVARALLARVYLYNESYPEAANEASAILNQTNLFTLENINQVFLVNSKETIWQLQSAEAGQNTQEASTFIFLLGPPALVALNNDLVGSFSVTDLRGSNWIKAVGDGTATWHHAYKYKEKNFTSISKEYSIVFRLAEQYLIRAEARAHQGDLIGAKEDLNQIRNRAGLDDTKAITKEEILDAILNERRWEFFTELGHRFFDLKRFNQINKVLSNSKPGWNTTDHLFPMPQSELSSNPNLGAQNPGY